MYCTLGAQRGYFEEEFDPVFPFAAGRNGIHQVDICILTALQFGTHVEDGRAQKPLSHRHERYQHPPDPPVSICEGMNCLELIVSKSNIDQRHARILFRSVDISFKVRHGAHGLFWRRWNETSRFKSGSADHVLVALEFAGEFVLASVPADALQQNAVSWTPAKTGPNGRAFEACGAMSALAGPDRCDPGAIWAFSGGLIPWCCGVRGRSGGRSCRRDWPVSVSPRPARGRWCGS